MRELIKKIFRASTEEPIIEMFNPYHFLYLGIIAVLIVALYFVLKNKKNTTKKFVLDILALALVILYLFDFLIQKIYNGSIIISKFPFHICTFMVILVPLSRFIPNLKKLKNTSVVFSVICSILYLIVPGTSLGYNAFCYYSLQTIVYHAILLSYAVLSIALNDVELDFKSDHWFDIGFMAFLLLWASFGNSLYPGEDWFFLEGIVFNNLASPLGIVIPVWLIYIVEPLVFITASWLIHIINKALNKRKKL